MAKGDRTSIVWFVKGPLWDIVVGSDVGQSYRLPWRVQPVEVWLKAKTAPTGREIKVDVLDDGVSIFATQATLPAGLTESRSHGFKSASHIEKGSVLTLDITQVGSGELGRDLSVSLELVEI